MGTYWDDFVKKYQGFCIGKTLTQILEAFYWYCHGEGDKTDKILKGGER